MKLLTKIKNENQKLLLDIKNIKNEHKTLVNLKQMINKNHIKYNKYLQKKSLKKREKYYINIKILNNIKILKDLLKENHTTKDIESILELYIDDRLSKQLKQNMISNIIGNNVRVITHIDTTL